MAIEKFPNNFVTQLNGSINDSTTSVVVDAVPTDVATGNFRIKIDGEIMKVTAITMLTLTVVRGQEGTSAASHADNASVYGVLTSAAIEQLRADAITSGALADAPSNSPGGRLYFPTDAPVASLSNGSTSSSHGPIHTLTAPVSGDFSWVNQGGASISTANGGVFLTCPATASPPKLRIRAKSAPSTPYTITALVVPDMYPDGNDQVAGIGFRESGTSKLETVHFVYSAAVGGFLIATAKWTSETAYSADRGYFDAPKAGSPRWLRIKDDGTNLFFQYSNSGVMWRTIASPLRGNFFTTGPDQVFFFGGAAAATYDVGVHLLSWKQE